MKSVKQQIHKKCGGGIVVIRKDSTLGFACNICGGGWYYPQGIVIPNDFRDIKKSDGMEIVNVQNNNIKEK